MADRWRWPDFEQALKAVLINNADLFIQILPNLISEVEQISIYNQTEENLNRMAGISIQPPTCDDKLICIDNALLLCTVYNRPKLLAKCESIKVKLPPSNRGLSLGERSLSFAEIMNYQDCLKELAKLFPETYNRYSPFQLAKEVIILDKYYNPSFKYYSIHGGVFKASFKRLLGNSINELNPFGKTFLHEVICECISHYKLSDLFDMGCDINMLDSNGETAFYRFCAKICSIDFDHRMKVLIMENPSVQLSGSADYHILKHEVAEFRQRLRYDAYRSLSTSELLSLPRTTLLHKHGFEFSCKSIARQLTANERALLHQVRLAHGVRKLSEICRIVLRQHYTGRAIHTFVKGDNVPKQLKDYILLKDEMYPIV